jgi:hypothetical protein
MVIAAGLLASGVALAQDEWKEEGGDKLPPDDHPAKPKEKEKEKEKEEAQADTKPTRFLVDLKIGPVFILAAKAAGTRGATEFGLQINAGYALAHDLATKGDAFYLTVSPYLIVGSDLSLVAPLGVQYDMPLTMIPYKGLSAYARASVGYAFYQPPLLKISDGIHSLAVQPALGAKLAIGDRFHVGIEPFGLDILHTFPTKNTTQAEDTLVAFQLAIFGGARF